MGRCVFCGEGTASREHVIPSWLDAPIKGSWPLAPGRLRIGLTHRYTPPPDSGGPVREWSAPGPDLVTKEVCETCNTEMLSQLETMISAAVGDMVVGHPVELGSKDQIAVATWCYKTILLMQLVRPGEFTLIPHQRYAEFYRLRRPPTDTRLWLGVVIQGSSVLHEVTTRVDMTMLSTRSPGLLRRTKHRQPPHSLRWALQRVRRATPRRDPGRRQSASAALAGVGAFHELATAGRNRGSKRRGACQSDLTRLFTLLATRLVPCDASECDPRPTASVGASTGVQARLPPCMESGSATERR